MVDQETVADPLRSKRPHQESSDTKDTGAAQTSLTPNQASKRIKVENGENSSQPQPLQKVPGPQTAKPRAAPKQQGEATSVPSKVNGAPISAGEKAPKPQVPIKQETSASTAHIKPAAVSKSQALPQPSKQSAPMPKSQISATSIKPPSVPLTPAPIAAPLPAPQKESPPPLKATTFRHLHRKYGPELDYMLVEFKKLERQLLGAPSHQQNPPKSEPKGSRERREKLHGFILHLEDTVRQVEEGLALEKQEEESAAQAVLDAVDLPTIDTGTITVKETQPVEEEKKSSDASLQQPQPNPQPNAQINVKDDENQKPPATSEATSTKFTAAEASLSALPPEKEREESVQRLEEHILANLLPVKVRLTKQLAAQKGATRNPLTAPVRAGAPAATTGGTIAEKVEAKRKAQEEELLKKQLQQRQSSSQYGKPIGGAGSSLTARLHGNVLTAPGTPGDTKRPILYAGVAPGSTQVSSSVSAVTGAHPGMVGKDATKALSLAEEEKRRLKALEENAARVALGGAAKPAAALDHRKPAALPKQPEGPATLAARARAIALAGTNRGGASKISRPNQQFPTRAMQQPRPALGAASVAAANASVPNQYIKPPYVPVPVPVPVPAIPTKPKKPHVKPNFDDPALTPEQQFELRMKEARWRQRKRRRERRRKRLEMYYSLGSYHAVHLPVQQQSVSLPDQPQNDEEIEPEPITSATAPLPVPSHPPAVPPPPPVNTLQPAQLVQARPKKTEVYGPRAVEYVCAVCNETYMSSSEFNPWWSLSNHECPKCGKIQVPKLDISVPANEIDYHPALLSQEDTGKPARPREAGPHITQTVKYIHRPSTHAKKSFSLSDSEVSFTDESDGEGTGGKYDESSEEEETNYDNDMDSVTREDRAEKEEFGHDFEGETLTEDQSKRLLVLIEHASICPGRHRSAKHRNVCHSTKYMMLHVRDCSGLLSNGDVCPFPWCRKTKHLLYHLVSCKQKENGGKCSICSPEGLSSNLTELVALNAHRRKIFVERVTKTKAMQAIQPPNHRPPTLTKTSATPSAAGATSAPK
ncbi:hypothetical protein ACHAWO_013018 [Cyclotella atomus]|uniref:TAZ-type domain-containing protein n=1 Tax=Cyclotella atomus TaxID=382360 RepID=A0ABD3PSF4_9STRA